METGGADVPKRHEITFRRADDAVCGGGEGARLVESVRNAHTSR